MQPKVNIHFETRRLSQIVFYGNSVININFMVMCTHRNGRYRLNAIGFPVSVKSHLSESDVWDLFKIELDLFFDSQTKAATLDKTLRDNEKQIILYRRTFN